MLHSVVDRERELGVGAFQPAKFGLEYTIKTCSQAIPQSSSGSLAVRENGRGKVLSLYITWMTFVYLDRQRGRGHQNCTFRTCVVCFETGAVSFLLYEHSKLQRLGQNLQDKAWSSFFDQEFLPPSVYLGRQNFIHVIKWTRPPPSVFVYCKRFKTGRRQGLGMGLPGIFKPCIMFYVTVWHNLIFYSFVA